MVSGFVSRLMPRVSNAVSTVVSRLRIPRGVVADQVLSDAGKDMQSGSVAARFSAVVRGVSGTFAERIRMARVSGAESVSFSARTSPAAPVTSGADNDVPLLIPFPQPIPSPGAARFTTATHATPSTRPGWQHRKPPRRASGESQLSADATSPVDGSS